MTIKDVFIKVAKRNGWDDARIEHAMKAASLNMPAPPDTEINDEVASQMEWHMSQMHDWAANSTPEEMQAAIDKLSGPHVAKN